MADKKISADDELTTLTDSEFIPLILAGNNYKVKPSTVARMLAAALRGTGQTLLIRCGTYTSDDNLYPDDGTAIGTGEDDAIENGNIFVIGTGGITLNGEFLPEGTFLEAMDDTPGQVPAKWRYY